MMLGEIAPGGVGSGLYGMLMLAVVTVFLAGLMVGRTPEYLGKKIGQREIVLVALYVLDHAGPAADRHRGAVTFDARAGRDPQQRPARLLRDAVRRHVGGQQQRLGVRRTHLGHAVLEHPARARDAVRPVPADGLRARAGRPVRRGQAAPRRRRHAAHAPAALRRSSSPASPSSSSASPTCPCSSSGRSWSPSREHSVSSSPTMRQIADALPGALRKLDPRELVGTPVMLVVEVGAVVTTVLSVDPSSWAGRSRSGCGSPSSSPPWPSRWPRAAARPRPPACGRSSRRRPRAGVAGDTDAPATSCPPTRSRAASTR